MGKRSKRGASLRAKKRADQTHQQLERALAEGAEKDRVQSKKDEELFVLDNARRETVASNQAVAARSAAEKEASRKRKGEFSENQKRRIRKLLNNHGKEGAIALAERGKARLDAGRNRERSSGVNNNPSFDLWGESPLASPNTDEMRMPAKDAGYGALAQPVAKLSKKQIKARKQAQASAPPQLAVEVAHPGQSYWPDMENHQDAIGEALSIEIRRNEAEAYKTKPISEGMTAFTRGCILESSEEDSSDDDDEDEEEKGTDDVKAKIIKRKEKLTRAQRNKQKRVRAEQTLLKERRKRKQFLHQANEVHVHSKAVKQAEREQRERQEEIAKLKIEKKSRPLGQDVWGTSSHKDPVRVPSLPIALTEELHRDGKNSKGGSLRTVIPKGSLVTDRLESMVARNMVSKKREEGRRIVQGKRRRKVRGAKGTEYLLV